MKKIVIPLIIGLLLACVVGAAYQPQLYAQRFLRRVKEIKVGSLESETLLALRNEFRSSLSVDDPNCTLDHCHVEFTFTNKVWWKLHLSPPIELYAILRADNHIIGYVSVIYRINLRQELSSSVTIFEFGPEEGKCFKVDAKPRKAGIIPFLNVRFTSLASEEDKRSAFALDLTCLSRPIKCRDAYDLAPLLPRRSDVHFLLD